MSLSATFDDSATRQSMVSDVIDIFWPHNRMIFYGE